MTYTFEMARAGSSEMEIFGFEPAGEGRYPSLVLVQHIPVGHTGIENDECTSTDDRPALVVQEPQLSAKALLLTVSSYLLYAHLGSLAAPGTC